MNRVKVSIVRCFEYEIDKVYDAVKHSLNLIGGLEPLKKIGRRALLKPNLISGKEPEYAVTTHPVFFEAVVKILKENDFEVAVGESPALENLFSVAKKCGLLEIIEKYQLPFIEFDDPEKTSNPEGKIVKNFNISKKIFDYDFLVSLPKLKTHVQMFYTGAMKNIFGCISGLQKAQFHLRFPERNEFAEMIVDLNLLLKPRLGIVDGIVAMEGHGPQNGNPKNLGVVASSFDLAALDLVCSEIIGYDYNDIPIIRNALLRKTFFISSQEEIEVMGERFIDKNFQKIKIPQEIHFLHDKIPRFLLRFVNNLTVPRPFFNHKKCIRCGRCVDICAAEALKFVHSKSKKRVSIDYKKCIKCYCCDEICPVDAIKLKIMPF